MGQIISNFRWRILLWALRQWGEHELDQWDRIRFQTKYGTVFVSIQREVPPEEIESYENVAA